MSEADERLVVMLEARIAEFERRMAAAERRGTRTHSQLTRGAKSAAASMERDLVTATQRINAALATGATRVGQFAAAFAGGLAGGAVLQLVGSLNLQIAGTVKALAEVGDQAKRAGVSVEAFQQLRYVAEQNRIGVDALTDGLKEMNLRLDEFVTTGAGPAAESLARLGYSASELRAKMADPSALLLEMVGRMEALDKAAQIRIADEVFGGTAGERFVELLSLGENGIRAQMDRAGELGLVLDQDVIAKAAELDAKFAEVSGRIDAMWKAGVIGAAEFFGFIDQEWERQRKRGELSEKEKQGNLLGADLAEALENNRAAAAAAVPDLQDLKFNYDQLQEAVTALSNTLSGDIATLVDLGAYDAAIQLSDVVSEMEALVAAVRDGSVPAAELEGRMSALITRAGEALTSVQDIDGVDLSGAVAAVDRVSNALSVAVSWAQGLIDKITAAAGMPMTTGTPLSGDGASLLPPSEGQMNSSPRPRSAPAMLGEGAGASGRRGGGGGGSSRIEALLSELQTEREVLDAWYAESLDLLNGATDAQLEALGGRHEAMERLEAEHMERLRDIRDAGQGAILGNAETFFGDMASAFAAGGDKMQKAARIFGALEAAANVGRAQAQVLADPTLPWWRKIPAALAIGAAGARIVASIKSGGTSSGGGGSGGASAGSSATAAAAAGPAPLRAMIEGLSPDELYSGKAVRTLLDRLMQEAGDRGIILVGGRA